MKTKIRLVKSLKKELERWVLKSFDGLIVVADHRLKSNLSKSINRIRANDKFRGVIYIKADEREKNLETIQKLWSFFESKKATRRTLVVAIGGGTVGDMTGFAASTFLRGLEWVNVPTTLLAMVDSSYGGKTGVNLGRRKNVIGTFWSPREVWLDQSFLSSLKPNDLISGYGEMIKYAVAFDSKKSAKWANKKVKKADIKNEILWCLKKKAEVVSRDPFDTKGVRKKLNFGHTFGHAVEIDSGLTHGECVLLGMEYALLMSYYQELLTDKELRKAQKVLSSIEFRMPRRVSLEKTWQLMTQDKKNSHGRVLMVLLKKLGSSQVDRPIKFQDHAVVMSLLSKRTGIEVTR